MTLDWLAQLLGLPPGLHGDLDDTASTGTLAALAAAREAKPGGRVVVCSEHAHPSVEKACRLLGLEARATPVATGEIFLSHTRLDGRYTLRLAVGNARTTGADVRHAWDVIRREAARR